ncbi:hypothetical protein HK100_000947 [Physocladia obscura]|uniref:L-type lectin-like domain-containing protein n=1 Tax=Physocladia obscura TaxID=109957 RepID=A0AAD5TBN8_9FUNG|nr:hypothetical protein HK100_000947 [Physocladia obscura]
MRLATVLLAFCALFGKNSVSAIDPPAEGNSAVNSVNAAEFNTVDNVGHGELERKYDYKQSLKRPFFIWNDSAHKQIPFFTHYGDTLASNEHLRLTPSLPNKAGSVWANNPNPHKEWQVHFAFKASGRAYAGGEGLALWYSKERAVSGNVMGSQDKWDGLALIFSTSARDDNRFTPYIYGALNDGKEIAGKNMRNNNIGAGNLGGCFKDYRNIAQPVWVRVTYKKRQLRVDIDLYKDGYEFIECFRSKDVDLPVGNYFGVSASTSSLTYDDHDVHGIEVFEVHPHPRKSKSRYQDEYVIDGATQKRIDEAKAAVEEAQQSFVDAGLAVEPEREAPFNPQMVQNLFENQFKIIEALDQLEQKVQKSPQDAVESTHERANAGIRSAVRPVDQKVEEIKGKVDALETKLAALDRDIKELLNVFHKGNSAGQMKLNEVSQKLDESHRKIKNAEESIVNAKIAARGGSVYAEYGLFFMIGAVVVYAVSVVLRMRKDRTPKKFI